MTNTHSPGYRARDIRHLAILAGDAPWNLWGDSLQNAELQQLSRHLGRLENMYIVLSLAHFWPPGFDNGVRVAYGFMPLDVEYHGGVWPWFDGEYEAVLEPLLSRVRQQLAQAARPGQAREVSVSLVFDVNHDGHWWHNVDNTYRRYVNTW